MEQNDGISSPVASAMPVEKKPNKLAWVAVTICAILAAGGIGFGIWATMSSNTQKDELRLQISLLKQQVNDLADEEIYDKEEIIIDDATVVSEKAIDNYLAQNLIAPYLGTFNYLNNLFDYDFTEDVKVEIAFKNLESSRSGIIYYSDLDNMYQDLFGGSLEKRDYAVGHSDSFKFIDDGGTARFEVSEYAGGGTGSSIFSVVKNARYDGQNIIVEVYHDRTSVCFDADNSYCVGEGVNSAVVDSIEEHNIQALIDKYSDRIPVYKMTFVKNNGHYMLSAVEKE